MENIHKYGAADTAIPQPQQKILSVVKLIAHAEECMKCGAFACLPSSRDQKITTCRFLTEHLIWSDLGVALKSYSGCCYEVPLA